MKSQVPIPGSKTMKKASPEEEKREKGYEEYRVSSGQKVCLIGVASSLANDHLNQATSLFFLH
jgi:hypothetical protein